MTDFTTFELDQLNDNELIELHAQVTRTLNQRRDSKKNELRKSLDTLFADIRSNGLKLVACVSDESSKEWINITDLDSGDLVICARGDHSLC